MGGRRAAGAAGELFLTVFGELFYSVRSGDDPGPKKVGNLGLAAERPSVLSSVRLSVRTGRTADDFFLVKNRRDQEPRFEPRQRKVASVQKKHENLFFSIFFWAKIGEIKNLGSRLGSDRFRKKHENLFL